MGLVPEPVRGLRGYRRIERPEIFTEFAFSPGVAREIKERNDWQCEVTGRKASDGWRLDASHIVHDRDDPEYNDEGNGECLCLTEHIKFHIGIYNDAVHSPDDEYFAWARASLQLICKRAYSKGLRTDEHYQEVPMDIIDDRDEIVETLVEHNLNPREFIL